MAKPITTMGYDDDQQRAVLTFPNGRRLILSNISPERAAVFLARHAAEFERRNCCLETPAGCGFVTREH